MEEEDLYEISWIVRSMRLSKGDGSKGRVSTGQVEDSSSLAGEVPVSVVGTGSSSPKCAGLKAMDGRRGIVIRRNVRRLKHTSCIWS